MLEPRGNRDRCSLDSRSHTRALPRFDQLSSRAPPLQKNAPCTSPRWLAARDGADAASRFHSCRDPDGDQLSTNWPPGSGTTPSIHASMPSSCRGAESAVVSTSVRSALQASQTRSRFESGSHCPLDAGTSTVRSTRGTCEAGQSMIRQVLPTSAARDPSGARSIACGRSSRDAIGCNSPVLSRCHTSTPPEVCSAGCDCFDLSRRV